MQNKSNNVLRRRLNIFLRRLVHIVRYPLAHIVHRWRFNVLARPGFAGYIGGVFNPGAIVLQDGSTLLVAKGQDMHWLDALKYHPEQLMAGAPVMLKFQTPISKKPFATKVLALKNFPDDLYKPEDFRVFRYGDEILVNHSMIRSVQNENIARPALSRLCESAGELHFLGFSQLDIETTEEEKNWVYLESNNRLLLFYSFNPFRVLQLVDKELLSFASFIDLKLSSQFTNPGAFDSRISLSVNPVVYDDNYYLLVVHQIERKLRNRRYHHWGVLLNRTTFLPERITNRPLFNALGARGRCQNVLYLMAVIKNGGEFTFFCGEGDSYVTRSRISHVALERSFEA